MAGNEVDGQVGYPDTWPGVVTRLLELGCESWGKLLRMSILLALLGGVAWVVVSTR